MIAFIEQRYSRVSLTKAKKNFFSPCQFWEDGWAPCPHQEEKKESKEERGKIMYLMDYNDFKHHVKYSPIKGHYEDFVYHL